MTSAKFESLLARTPTSLMSWLRSLRFYAMVLVLTSVTWAAIMLLLLKLYDTFEFVRTFASYFV